MLGINGSSKTLYLAVGIDGEIVDQGPYVLSEPTGLAPEQQLPALRDETVRLLQALGIDRMRVLDAETSYSASYTSMRPRLTLETVVLLAAAEAGVDSARLTRARLRSLLGLPRAGQLGSHVSVLTKPVGGSWSPNKRDVAALAALAAGRD